MISDELYDAIVEAEKAARKVHDLCYVDNRRHGAPVWMTMQFGKAQSIFMHYVVKYANRRK